MKLWPALRPALTYRDFVVTVEASPREGYRVRILSSPFDRAEGPFVLPFALEEFAEILETTEYLVRASGPKPPARSAAVLEPPRGAGRRDLGQIGEALFRALFVGDVGDKYRKCRALLDAESTAGLRLRLAFDPRRPELLLIATLPWELMVEPETQEAPSRNFRTPILRTLEEVPWPAKPRLAVEKQLRILVVVASPKGTVPLDLQSEQLRIRQAWGKQAAVEVVFLEKATVQAAHHALREGHFHIFHFMGHAEFDRGSGEGSLLFESPSGEKAPVIGQVLADSLRGISELRLVLLNACAISDGAIGTAEFVTLPLHKATPP